MYANFTCDVLTRKSLESKLYAVNERRVANEQDFDGATGELAKNSSSVLLLDSNHTEKIINWLSGMDASSISPEFKLVDIETRNINRKPPSPFITSTLQQEASRKLGLSPSRTMSIAQSLYEEGFITYMRTDSPHLSSTASSIAQDLVKEIFGPTYLGSATLQKSDAVKTKGKERKMKGSAPVNAQEAHEAIRPTESAGSYKSPEDTGLSGPARALYTLIYTRTLASVMSASMSQSKTYVVEGTKPFDSEFEKVTFRSSNTEVLFKGFLAAYEVGDNASYSARSNKIDQLSLLTMGQKLWLSSENAQSSSNFDGIDNEGDTELSASEGEAMISLHPGLKGVMHTTRPPSRYSEASFIKELESIGVGRPSTYSKILQILKERLYVIVDKQTIIPTVKGLVVIKLLEKHFPELVESEFTAFMEKCLDLIAQGGQDRISFLREFYLGERNDQLVNEGLLTKANQKIENAVLDHRDCRSLEFPPIADLGLLKLGSSDIYLETGSNETKIKRWVLPADIQGDIRLINRDTIQRILLTQADTSGFQKGEDPISGKPVAVKSGRYRYQFSKLFICFIRFGKYAQIGEDSDKQRKNFGVPHWIDGFSALEDVLEFSSLPKFIGVHPELQKDIFVEVASRRLSVVVEGFPLKVALPDGIFPSQVTLDICMDILPSIKEIIESNRLIGFWNGEEVCVRRGRFGFYIKCGSVVASLGKLKSDELTLEQAIGRLESKLKRIESRKSKSNKKKAKNTTSTLKKKRSAYHVRFYYLVV